MAASSPLYGDLMNGLLFTIVFPQITYDVIALHVYASIEERDRAGLICPLVLWASTGALAICSWMAYYYSRFETDLDDAVESSHDAGNPRASAPSALKRYHLAYRGISYKCRPSRLWSYCAYGLVVLGSAEVSLFNWPHKDQPVLLGQFIWHLLVATANVSHSLRVKQVMGGVNLVAGTMVLLACPKVYTFVEWAPKLTGISAIYFFALYWIEKSGNFTRINLISSSKPKMSGTLRPPSRSTTLPFPITAVDEPTKPSPFLSLTQENMSSHVAFAFIFCFLMHFFAMEVHGILTQPGYMSTAMLNICQTGVLGAAGFIASGALRNANKSSVVSDANENEAAYVMASMAFHASPTPMVITNTKRVIEDHNPAFAQVLSTISTFKNLSLEIVLGLTSVDDIERLQKCYESAGSGEGRGENEMNHEEFDVSHQIIHIRVSIDSSGDSDPEAASSFPFFGFFGFLVDGKKPRRRRFIVVVHDVTLDRDLSNALQRSTMLQRNSQNETLMRHMMDQIAVTMQSSHIRAPSSE